MSDMENIVRIDARRALEVIDKAVEERGEDWVYPDQSQCRYFYDPQDYEFVDDEWEDEPVPVEAKDMVEFFGDEVKPACLVGCAMHLLDDRLDTFLIANNEQSVDGLMPIGDDDTFSTVVGDVRYVFEQDAVIVLQAGQSAQDIGLPWGEARLRAYAAAERMGIH